jgi:hypothetical protein
MEGSGVQCRDRLAPMRSAFCYRGSAETNLFNGARADGAPYGNRTRVSAVKGRRPGPLDEGRWSARRYKEVCLGGQATDSPKQRVAGTSKAPCEPAVAWPPGFRARAGYDFRSEEGRGRRAVTTSRCSASISTALSAAADCPSAAVRSSACRASARTPCCRRAAVG